MVERRQFLVFRVLEDGRTHWVTLIGNEGLGVGIV